MPISATITLEFYSRARRETPDITHPLRGYRIIAVSDYPLRPLPGTAYRPLPEVPHELDHDQIKNVLPVREEAVTADRHIQEAAPELYAALRKVAQQEVVMYSYFSGSLKREIEQALRKAEGK